METKKIYEQMIEVMSEVGAVGKGQQNKLQNYAFRGIDDMLNAAHPALIKAGVLIVPTVLEKQTDIRESKNEKGNTVYEKNVTLTVEFSFISKFDGSIVKCVTVGEGQDRSDKAFAKAHSSAMKTALIETLCIPTKDIEDSDKDERPKYEKKEPVVKKEKLVEPATSAQRQLLEFNDIKLISSATKEEARTAIYKLLDFQVEELKKNGIDMSAERNVPEKFWDITRKYSELKKDQSGSGSPT